jgi:hypothetical protein
MLATSFLRLFIQTSYTHTSHSHCIMSTNEQPEGTAPAPGIWDIPIDRLSTLFDSDAESITSSEQSAVLPPLSVASEEARNTLSSDEAGRFLRQKKMCKPSRTWYRGSV